MIRRLLFLLPVVAFSVLVGFFGFRIVLMAHGDTPDLVPSVMIDRPAPSFDLPPLFAGQTGLKTADLKGRVTVINFFASWCLPCRAEHPLLAGLKGKGAVLAGINYKDKRDDVKKWFAGAGNPYDIVAADADGRSAIDFGLYGVPETYLIDSQGIIRFKQIGPLTPKIIRGRLLPLIEELNK